MTDKVLILSTCGSPEEADRVAYALVEGRAAACVNIVPGLRSIYRWQGSIENASELLLLIKTRLDLVPQVESILRSTHSYDLPEMIAIPIEAGLEGYLDWIARETAS